MRCVKLTFPRPVRERWLFRIWRLTSSSFAGTLRTDVAVGTPRLASMFSTMRAAAPPIGFGGAPRGARGRFGGLAVGHGRRGAVAAGGGGRGRRRRRCGRRSRGGGRGR